MPVINKLYTTIKFLQRVKGKKKGQCKSTVAKQHEEKCTIVGVAVHVSSKELIIDNSTFKYLYLVCLVSTVHTNNEYVIWYN
jgi:hypothetical protein